MYQETILIQICVCLFALHLSSLHVRVLDWSVSAFILQLPNQQGEASTFIGSLPSEDNINTSVKTTIISVQLHTESTDQLPAGYFLTQAKCYGRL